MQGRGIAKPRLRLSLIAALASALAIPTTTGAEPDAFTGLHRDAELVTMTVAVADWVKRLTLESRTNLESGAWSRRAWQPVSATGTITLQIDRSEKMAVFRFRAEALPAFLDRVTLGLASITNIYPDGVLYEVNQTGSGPTLDPNDLPQLRIVCRVSTYRSLRGVEHELSVEPAVGRRAAPLQSQLK